MDLYNKIVEATSILYTRVYDGWFFFFDLWSLNHMWSGFILFLIATALKVKRPLLIIPVFLTGYEIFEILLTYFACNIFIPEIIKDQFTDVFIGFAGSCIGFCFVSNYDRLISRYQVVVHRSIIFFVSMTFAYLWLVLSHISVCAEGNFLTMRNLTIFFIWLSQAYCTIEVFRTYGLFKSIRPWLIFMLTFVFSTLLNYTIITLTDTSMSIKPDLFITWIYSIRIKMILSPFLPFLLLSSSIAFEKLILKSVAGFSSYRMPYIRDFSEN